jgi:hypothetical protein
MPRPQFRLRSLFILTAIVAVGCLVGPPIVREVRDWLKPKEVDIDVWSQIIRGPTMPGFAPTREGLIPDLAETQTPPSSSPLVPTD